MVKCDICNYTNALSLTDHEDNITFNLCPNHLLQLITHSLGKEEVLILIKKYSNKTFYLHDDFYDPVDGTAFQPVHISIT